MFDTTLLPSKVAPLSQSGVDVVTNWARANPDLAKEAAVSFRDQPRATIERFFRLTTDQQAGLATIPDASLRMLVAPLADRWSGGSFPYCEFMIQYEDVVDGSIPVKPGPIRPSTDMPVLDNVVAPQQSQQAPQSPAGGAKKRCKEIAVKIIEIVQLLL